MTTPAEPVTDAEEDLLRSAVVFAGAGLDSALKELLRQAAVPMTNVNEAAKRQLVKFTEEYLSGGEVGVSPKRLARLLLGPGLTLPREVIVGEYRRSLTGESLQSVSQVRSVCSALAIDDSEIRKRLKDGSLLDEMFRARNPLMVHELDLLGESEEGPTGRTKHSRTIDACTAWATEALSVGQEMINSVASEFSRHS